MVAAAGMTPRPLAELLDMDMVEVRDATDVTNVTDVLTQQENSPRCHFQAETLLLLAQTGSGQT